MRPASHFTITRGTETGSEVVAYVEAGAADDLKAAGRVIVDLLSALEFENIKHGWPLEYARIRAEFFLQERGLVRLPEIAKASS